MSSYIKQNTLNGIFKISGVGLHTGKFINVTFRPSKEDTGIIFRRIDYKTIFYIPALFSNVQYCNYSTVLNYKGVSIYTVEHLLFALSVLSIDNIIIDLDGEEIPILDGSAYPFIKILRDIGITCQNKPRKFIKIKKKIIVNYEDRFVILSPYNKYKMLVKLDFSYILLNYSENFIETTLENLLDIVNISKSKTFGFLDDYGILKKNGLIQGANIKNVVVFNNKFILNEDIIGSNYSIIKHKILDSFGDMNLLGKKIIGFYYAYKPGHMLNNMLLNKLMNDIDSYEMVLCKEF